MSFQSNYTRPKLNIPGTEPCPKCGQPAGKRVRYAWWGGAIGPALMNLTKCQACGYQFNAKTGQSTKKAIIVYNVVAFGVVIVFGVVYYFQRS